MTVVRLPSPQGELPPHDIEAERQVLGACILRPELLRDMELSTADFWGEGHRRIWTALQYLAAEGEPIDALHLRSHLIELGQLESVGGDTYLLDLTDTIPVSPPADIVRKLARQRGVQAIGRRLERAGQAGDLESAQTAVREAQRALEEVERRPIVEWRGPLEVFASLPPVQWRVRGLQICPGRPSFFVGVGASAKTLSAQSMLLSLAAGERVWGHFEAPPLRVCHLDYEQGWHATARRYQRLALGHRIDPRQISDRLRVAVFPGLYLDQPGAEDAYARIVDGADLVLLDSFKACTPAQDENDNGIRVFVDALTRVSERTGCAFLVIHHAGKAAQIDQRANGRGASSIFDSAGSWFNFYAGQDKHDPRTVKQAKMPAEAEGLGVQPFELDLIDGEQGAVHVAYREVTKADPAAVATERFHSVKRLMLDLVRRAPGKPRDTLVSMAGVNKSVALRCLDELETDGFIVTRTGARNAKLMYPADSHRRLAGGPD